MFKKSSFFIRDLLALSTLSQEREERKPLSPPRATNFTQQGISGEPSDDSMPETPCGCLGSSAPDLTKARSLQQHILDLTLNKERGPQLKGEGGSPYSVRNGVWGEVRVPCPTDKDLSQASKLWLQRRGSLSSPEEYREGPFPGDNPAQSSGLLTQEDLISTSIVGQLQHLSSSKGDKPFYFSGSHPPDSPPGAQTKLLFTIPTAPSSSGSPKPLAHFSPASVNLLPAAAAALTIQQQQEYDLLLRDSFAPLDPPFQRDSCELLVARYSTLFAASPLQELQLTGLEQRFETQKYLSTPDRIDLAKNLGLSQLQVKTWYQNRRMKWKKQVMQDGRKEAPTKPKGRPKKNSVPSLAELQRQQFHQGMNLTREKETGSEETRMGGRLGKGVLHENEEEKKCKDRGREETKGDGMEREEDMKKNTLKMNDVLHDPPKERVLEGRSGWVGRMMDRK